MGQQVLDENFKRLISKCGYPGKHRPRHVSCLNAQKGGVIKDTAFYPYASKYRYYPQDPELLHPEQPPASNSTPALILNP